MRKTKLAFFHSVIALLLCVSMLVGTTFAWFTDSVSSAKNQIIAGNLDIELAYSKDMANWSSVAGKSDIVDPNALWEPGHTEVVYLKISNEGTLGLKYSFNINFEDTVVGKSVLGNDIYLSQYLKYAVVDVNSAYADRDAARKAVASVAKPLAGYSVTGTMAKGAAEKIVALVIYMPETVGNEANYRGDAIPRIDMGITLIATQNTNENDSFGNDYDAGLEFPQLKPGNVTVDITGKVEDGKLTENVTMANEAGNLFALVPQGTKVTGNSLTLGVATMNATTSDVKLQENQILRPMDVHIDGIAEDNDVPAQITVKEAMMQGLNLGNYAIYHVEDGKTNTMTPGDLNVHNGFTYDPATGDLSVAMATFSEVAVVAEPPTWKGNFDYSWYTNAVAPVDGESVTEYIIANADQLAAFGAIVGGMAEGIEQDSFSGKTVKLVADVNLDDDEKNNKSNIIFYPIGYNSSDGKYEKTGVAVTTGFYSFCGTFDGNGHTISNFYQNTWEMKGDHNWYDATLQYYRDGMGLFGKVYGGTVKNLTVSNFSSDGEIATTGVIAAYADGATFENIAITNCNPRVYNIGNGGIVGCVGWYAKEADLKTTFTNITVDNSNKISALWGSYDVACGGIVGQYYPTSGQSSADYPANAGIYMENCHVAAQIDVYNDVCANYQYYAYRYAGMLIGSVRENVTIDGHSYPKMDGITAKDCTVHFGTWNDYYYCEIIDNTTASYTHDYQMSRLTQVASVDVENMEVTDLKGNTTAIPTSGRVNYVIVNGEHATENATCYHFKDGKVWNHEDGGKETINGVEVLKEDKQHIYLEFNNLVTGYGWGVTSRGFDNLDGVTNLDITAGDHENSVKKFEGKVNELANNKTYKLGDIFSFVDNGVELIPGALTVAITNKAENNPVSATIVYDRENWENGTITLTGTGEITITIQDYYFCTPTTIDVTVTDRQPEEKFDVVMNNGNFLHRVGNVGAVALEKLFKAKADITGTVSVTVEAIDKNMNVSGTYTANPSDWAKGTIQFSDTGVVKVTITDNDYCIPTELYLEVVNATNATSATDAKDKDVVLLNNIGSGFTIDNGHTVYGNGFTLTYTGDGRYLNNGLKQGVVMVQNGGTLDNLRINASIYPTAFMYYGTTQLGDYVQQSSNPREVEGDKTRYYYQLSAVATYGDATISNCYIYGGRTNIYVNTGNVTIKDSVLECGIVANVQIQSTSEYTVTLDNITTIQYRVNATIGDTSKVMLGVGVLVGPETTSNPTIVLEGDFKQYNWVNADDQKAVSSQTAKMIVGGALDATEFNHTVNDKTASNLGIIYMNEATATYTNNTGLPYKLANVTLKYGSAEVKGQVYSLQNATAAQIYSDYVNADRSTVNGDYMPTFDFDLGDQKISYDGSEDTRYLYGDKNGVTALYQDGEAALTLDLSKLATIYKYTGLNYAITAVCKDASGNALTATNGVVTLAAQGKYTLEFTVADNIFYDKNGNAVDKSVKRTFSVPLTLTVKEANIKNAVVNITKTALDGVYTTVNLTDFKLRVNFLDAISVTDYDNKGNGTIVSLSSNIASVSLTPASVNVFTTASTITVTYTDGRVLTVNLSKISGSSPGTKTATVNTSGGLYFITEGALDNKPTASSNQNKCTITSVSFKGNSGSTVTNDTDVTVTWALGSGGCVTGDTLVTLADGTQKRIDQVTYADQILVWNFYTGEYDVATSAALVNHGYDYYEVTKLMFSDGTELKFIGAHGVFHGDSKSFVDITSDNVSSYVGEAFLKANANGFEEVTLVDYEVAVQYEESWTIVSEKHYNAILNGMFTANPSVIAAFPDAGVPQLEPYEAFEITDDLKFDEVKMIADIETYGLYTYEEFADYISYEKFEAWNIAALKVVVGKGYATYDDVLNYINIILAFTP